MKALQRVVDFIVYSNIFIGLCAVGLVFTNQLAVNGRVELNTSVGFVFFSTMVAYSLLKFRKIKDVDYDTTHQSWARQNRILLFSILGVAAIVAVCFFFLLNTKAKIAVVALSVFTGFYGFINIPFIKPGRKLRDAGLLKTAIVAIVWSLTTVIVPFAGRHVDTALMVFLILRRFLFILALTMVFEIKDKKADEAAGLNTLVMVLGVKGLKIAAQAVLVIMIVINVVQYLYFNVPFHDMLAVNLSLAVSAVFIQPVNEETPDKWYYLVLDGMMLLQFVFVYLAYLLVK